MRKPPQPWRLGRRIALRLLVLVAFLGALATSGTAYAFCPHAKRVMQSAAKCCGGRHAKAKSPAPPEVQRQSCCEIRSLDALPTADTPATPVIVAAPVVEAPFALEPPAAPRAWIRVAPSPPRAAVPIRAGPQTAAERCVLLQKLLH